MRHEPDRLRRQHLRALHDRRFDLPDRSSGTTPTTSTCCSPGERTVRAPPTSSPGRRVLPARGKHGRFYASILYNFSYGDNDPFRAYDSPWVYRIRATFGFLNVGRRRPQSSLRCAASIHFQRRACAPGASSIRYSSSFACWIFAASSRRDSGGCAGSPGSCRRGHDEDRSRRRCGADLLDRGAHAGDELALRLAAAEMRLPDPGCGARTLRGPPRAARR